MNNSGKSSERSTEAPQAERLTLHEVENVQDVTRYGDISLRAMYPHAMRALDEMRGIRQPFDLNTNMNGAMHDLFQPKIYGSLATQLAEASHSFTAPQFEAPVSAAQQPAAQPISQEGQAIAAQLATTPEQVSEMQQLDRQLDAAAASMPPADTFDLQEPEGVYQQPGYLQPEEDPTAAARRSVEDAHRLWAQGPADDNQMEMVG